jgi:hypothetical protein
VRLYTLEQLPYPHTFRDEQITDYMRQHYDPDAPGSVWFQKAHRAAYLGQDPGYLAMMCTVLAAAGLAHVGRVRDQAVALVAEHGDAVSDVVESMQPRNPMLTDWLSRQPIYFRDDEFGDGQHRVMALRLFCGPDGAVPAVRTTVA